MLNYLLLIDEDQKEHEFFQTMLSQHNSSFRLLTASNGKKGVQIFRKVKPAFTFINFQLADMDGVKCLDAIKKIKNVQDIPIYIFYRGAYEQALIYHMNTVGKDYQKHYVTQNRLNGLIFQVLRKFSMYSENNV